MNFSGKLFAVIALLLISSFAISLVAIPAANAHTPKWNITTYAYINAAPNPVGVGQQVYVIFWIDKSFDPLIAIGNDWRFHNYKLTITDPDGHNVTETWDIVWDTTSAQNYAFTPDKVGTYILTFDFPGQDYNTYPHNPNSDLVNDTFLASSASTTLTVQEEQLPAPIHSYPLPAEYWTRPIYGENPGWWTISSNWLGQGAPVSPLVGSGDIGAYGFSTLTLNRFPGDAIGPRTSHIMWTKPLQSGGVVGGNNFEVQGDTYFEGSAYNQRFINPIIMDGMLFYQTPLSFLSEGTLFGPASTGTFAVDLRTGKEIWSSTEIPAGQLSFGYIYDVQNPNQKGVYPPILFTSNFAQAYDADTGTFLFNVVNAPGGPGFLGAGGVPETMGPMGEHVRYIMTNYGNETNPNWYLAQWNSSRLWDWGVVSGSLIPRPDISPSLGAVDATTSNRYDWNISMPFANTMPVPMTPFGPGNPITQVAAFYNNMIICYNGTLPVLSTSGLYGISSIQKPYTYFAIDVNKTHSTFGQVLWWNTVNPPTGNLTVLPGPADPTTGVFTEGYKETMRWVGYSMHDGSKLWGPTEPLPALDYFGNPITPLIQAQLAYGKLYTMGYAGILFCYDLTNGTLLWTYGNGGEGNSTFTGLNAPFGHYPTFINAVGNGIVYIVSSEHTVNTPIYKGALTRAINATDGTEIWTLSDYTGEFAAMSYAIADGFATFFNGYDNQIYVVGRGPSATTVSAPATAAAFGEPVVIKGTVTDIAAGTKQDEQAADFPNGVPAVSDASMTEWMGYVYQQKPRPADAVGVNVTLSVLDSNNNCYEIGTATTDADGFFTFEWTPIIPGMFKVYATFEGTNGYWPSRAVTSFTVMQAPEATPPPTPSPAPLTDTYVAGFGIAIIIVIIAGIVVLILMLRKR
jgi:hypothetical protein